MAYACRGAAIGGVRCKSGNGACRVLESEGKCWFGRKDGSEAMDGWMRTEGRDEMCDGSAGVEIIGCGYGYGGFKGLVSSGSEVVRAKQGKV